MHSVCLNHSAFCSALAAVTKSTLKAKKASGRSGRRSSRTAADGIADAVLQGKLMKKSFNWSSRWFALRGNGSLCWWDSARSATAGKKPKGTLSLLGAHVGKPPKSGLCVAPIAC